MLNTKTLLSFFLISLAMACVNKRKDTDTPVPASAHSYTQLRTGSQWVNGTFQGKAFSIRKFQGGAPSPLIIAFHGGGFVSGSKEDMIPATLNATQGYNVLTEQQLDDAGIAYVTFDYSLLNNSNLGVHKPLNQCLEFVKHMRNNDSSYNIDPNKIILMGFSAGAEASLWIGLQNPALNIKGIVTLSPQASLNMLDWKDQVFAPFGQLSTYNGWIAQSDNNSVINHASYLYLYTYYFSPYFDPVNYAYFINYNNVTNYSIINNLNLLNLIDSSDPELYLSSTGTTGDLMHHTCHVYALQKKAQEKNLRSKIHLTKFPFYTHPNAETVVAFCARKFNE